jgi:Family of unknown function (DUF6478)
MASPLASLYDRLIHRRMLRRWMRLADSVETLAEDDLRDARNRARQTRRQLDELIHKADIRIALAATGPDASPRPKGADWAWRPAPWNSPIRQPGIAAFPTGTVVGDAVKLHHNCRESQMVLRQIGNNAAQAHCPFAISLEVFGFDGDFLSLAIDLPSEAVAGLKLRHLIRLEIQTETERPSKTYARLNVRHGPNTDQILRELPAQQNRATVDFDLSHTPVDDNRIEGLWLDVIFEAPRMNRLVVRDLHLSRRPRAAL